MKNYILKYTLGILLILGVGMVSCDDRDDELKELDLARNLTPYKLTAEITNTVNLALKWDAPKGANGYIIELYTVDLESKEEVFYHMDEVLEKSYELTDLQGDTQYLAKVKAVSVDNEDSNWATVPFKTGFKSISLPSITGDVTKTSIKFRWTPGAKVTELVLSVPDGNEIVRRAPTEAELASGIAEFTGLNPNVKHTLKLSNDGKLVGESSETTLPDGAIPVSPNDNLKEKLEGAEEGDIFQLAAGDYLAVAGEVITITKSITVMGASGAEPTITAQFEFESPAGVSFRNVVLDGKGTTDYVVRLISIEGDYNDILIESSEVKNYKKALIGADKITGKVASIVINNSVITDILTDGSEAIDIRFGFVPTLTLTNSTFNNVAPGRSFIRLDDSAAAFPSQTSVVTIADCTLHKVANSISSKGLLYVRFTSNVLNIERNIFSNTDGFFSADGKTSQPICVDNNYFNAPNFLPGGAVAKAKVDGTDPSTTDPQFQDPENGNFKTVISGKGDPRWYQ